MSKVIKNEKKIVFDMLQCNQMITTSEGECVSRDTSFTIQNALFGAMQITENATDNSKNDYKGYGMCFDERSQLSHTITEDGITYTSNGRNVLIFGVDMSFSAHASNRANHIYVMGDGLTQGINDTTLYVEKKYFRNFTEPDVKFVLSLHYNGDDGYLLVNGRQELKFQAKTDQLVKEKLCIGNLSDQWTTSESGLYRNIYDFVLGYKPIRSAVNKYGIQIIDSCMESRLLIFLMKFR